MHLQFTIKYVSLQTSAMKKFYFSVFMRICKYLQSNILLETIEDFGHPERNVSQLYEFTLEKLLYRYKQTPEIKRHHSLKKYNCV